MAGPLLRLISDQRVAFLLVGATNTAIGTGWFVALQLLVGHHIGYMGVLFAAHICAVLCAFVLYRKLVFRVRGYIWRDLARFEIVNLSSLAINACLLPLFVQVLGLPVIVSQLTITSLTMMVSFFGHRGFSFRRSTRELSTAEALEI